MTGPDGWASAVPSGTPDETLVPFDASRPNIARAYDYLLGGKDHFPADRHLAERLLAIYPGVRQMVKGAPLELAPVAWTRPPDRRSPAAENADVAED